MQSGGQNTPGSAQRHRRSAKYQGAPVQPTPHASSMPQSYAPPAQQTYQPAQTQWPTPPAQFSYQQPQQPMQQGPYYQPFGQQGYVPPKPPAPQKPPKKKGSKIVTFLITLVVIAVMAAGIVGVTYVSQEEMERQTAINYVASFDNVFCQGVYVDGIHLAGMTWDEAVNAVTEQALHRNDDWYLNLTYQGQVLLEIRAEHLGKSVDVTSALTQAWAQGHTGDAQERLIAMEAMLTKPFYAYTAESGGSMELIEPHLQEIADYLYAEPRDAALLAFNPKEISNPFTFQSEQVGQSLDVEKLRTSMLERITTMTSGDLEIEVDTIQPGVTVEELKKTVALRASVYTEISTSSTEERTNNIKKAFEYMDGTVLAPGKTFSFNNVVGERKLERGFYSAIEYAYGEETMGVGGGVCQASSTLYIAAVEAGLEIVKREPHSMKVNYTEYGRDATVNLDGKKIDLTFKNNTESNVYIVCSVQSNPDRRYRYIAKVSIYGPSLGDNVRYELQTETVEILPVPEEPVNKKDKNAAYVTYTDQTKTIKGKEGCVVQSYRVKYESGEEVERIPLYTDTYKAQATVIYTGVKERKK